MSDVSNPGEPAGAFPWRQVGLLSVSHVLADGYVSFHQTLMPLLAENLGFTASAAGLAVAFLSVPSNFGQPVAGQLTEGRRQKAFLIGGLVLAMAAASCIGLAGSYSALLPVFAVAGIGLAVYHPASASLTGSVFSEQRGLAVSLWSCGGSLGVMAGPFLIGAWVGRVGRLDATVWALLPGAILLAPVGFWLVEKRKVFHKIGERDRGTARRAAFGQLMVQGVLRGVAVAAFLSFLPFFCRRNLDMSPSGIGLTVGVFSGFGVAGVLLGGRLADRKSRRRVMAFPILLSPVVLLAFVLWPSLWTLPALALGGMLVWAGHSVNIVLAYEYMPHRASLASGLIIGGTWGTASLTLSFWGWLADTQGPNMALIYVLLTAPILAGIMALLQPHTEVRLSGDTPR